MPKEKRLIDAPATTACGGGARMNNADRIDKPCKNCGKLMVAVNPQRMFCVDCRKERVQKQNARYRDRHREELNRKAREQTKKALLVVRTVDAYCTGCVYLGRWQRTGLKCCNYFLITDKRRPCPAGKGCTVRKG